MASSAAIKLWREAQRRADDYRRDRGLMTLLDTDLTLELTEWGRLQAVADRLFAALRLANPCTLGTLEFAYTREHALLRVLVGHGVELVRGGVTEARGVLDPQTDTLVSGAGGAGIETGDTIRHTTEACQEGLYQGAR